MKKLYFFILSVIFMTLISVNTVFAGDAVIDDSQLTKGIVSVKYTPKLTKPVMVQIAKGDAKYNYSITSNNATTFPLQMGAGSYKITVLEQATGNKYKAIETKTVTLGNVDEKVLYTNSIQFVYFNGQMVSIKEMNKIASTAKTQTEKVNIIYQYIVDNFKYDFDKAASVQTGYIPNVEDVYKKKKGICFDYASLFASALRANNIPAKLQMGYFTEVEEYHAWNEVLVDGKWYIIDTTYDAQAKEYKLKFTMKKDKSQFTVQKYY